MDSGFCNLIFFYVELVNVFVMLKLNVFFCDMACFANVDVYFPVACNWFLFSINNPYGYNFWDYQCKEELVM